MKRIKVVIEPNGEVKVEALGYTGASCELDTRELETALGVPGRKAFKVERYQAETLIKGKV